MTKSQLKSKIEDISAGACGRRLKEGEDWFSADELSRLIPALMETFPATPKFIWEPHCLHNFDSTKTITDFLWFHIKKD